MAKKILYFGDSPTVATGFGVVSKEICKTLIAQGYEVEVVGLNYDGGFYDSKEFPYKIYPAIYRDGKFPYNEFIEVFKKSEFDILFTLNDVGVQDNIAVIVSSKLRDRKGFKWVAYAPIDMEYLPKEHLAPYVTTPDLVVTYTQFGRDVIREHFPKEAQKVAIIGHGTDTEVFKPIGKEDRRKFRDNYFKLHSKDFIVVNTSRNQWRKDLFRTLDGFNRFLWTLTDKQKERAYLYLHCMPKDYMGGSLIEMVKFLNLQDRVILPPEGFKPNDFSREQMNLVYNSADAVVSSSTGEGWGLQMTEAMSCKIPVIMPDNTSHKEVLDYGNRGFLVECDGYTVAYTKNNFPRPTVNVDKLAEALRFVYGAWDGELDKKEDVDKKVKLAYEWAVEQSWDNVNKEWVKVLSEL